MKLKVTSLMKRRMAILSTSLLFGGYFLFAGPVYLGVGYDDDPETTIPPHGKAPAKAPTIWQDGYTLTFPSSHPEYALDIIQSGVVVYSAIVEEDASSVTLPSWLSGEYEIELFPEGSSYYFIGSITL